MALNIPENYAQVGIQFRRAGDPDPWYITYGILIPEGSPEPHQIAQELKNFWHDHAGGKIPADTIISGVQLRIGFDAGDPLTLFYPFSTAGSGSGTTLPQNCAVLISKQTVRPGRTGKGRIFWPTIAEGDVNGLGQIDNGARESFQSDMDDVFEVHRDGELGYGPYPMYLLHNEGVPGGDSPTEITGLQVAPVIATQRRRLR